MALLFIDGFDHYDPQQLDAFGDPWLARGKADYLSPQATRIQGRRPSSYALRLPAGSGGGYVKHMEAGGTSLIVGAALRVAPFENTGALPLLLGVRDTSGDVGYSVKISEDSRVQLYRLGSGGYEQLLSTSDVSIPARGWHYVELQIVQGTSNGTLNVRVNGVLAITLSAQNTTQGGGPLLTAFVGAIPGQACPVTVDVDDLYLADTSGTINNTFLGDVRVDALRPQADGAVAEWTSTAGPAWQTVRDGDEATGIVADSSGKAHTFDVESLPAMTSPVIHGAQVTVLAQKLDGGDGRLCAIVDSYGARAVSEDIVLQEQLAWHTAMFEADPSIDAMWVQGALDAAEFGVQSV